MIILLIFLIATILILLVGGGIQIGKRSINPPLLFIWLIVVIYLTLLFSSPYFLFLLFLSLFIEKLFLESYLWKRFMGYSLYLLLFMVLFNLLLVQKGEHVILQLPLITITWESLSFAYSMGLRIIIMMGAFAIFNSNVSMDELIEILEKFKFPQSSLITLALSLRFFNIIAQEASDSLQVLSLRGFNVSSGKLRDRVKSRYPAMVALLNNSLERGIQVAEALEIKGFPSKTRNPWKRLRLSAKDVSIAILLLFDAIIATVLLFYGKGNELLSPDNILWYIPLSFLTLTILTSRRENND